MIKMNDELNRIGKSEIDNHFVGSNPTPRTITSPQTKFCIE